MRKCRCSTNTTLVDAQHGAVQIADVRWGDINLAIITDWTPFVDRHIPIGDERVAWAWKSVPFTESETWHKQSQKQRTQARATYEAIVSKSRLDRFQTAVRANRQLATTLRAQGMSEQADYFAYRAQVVQRAVLRQQRRFDQFFFSLLLWALAGYGYRLRRILFTYILTLLLFSAAFYAVGLWQGPALAPQQAFLVSLTAVHGRVFFEQFGLNSLLSWVAAIESVVGIVIEGVFVAMLVQRFFAR